MILEGAGPPEKVSRDHLDVRSQTPILFLVRRDRGLLEGPEQIVRALPWKRGSVGPVPHGISWFFENMGLWEM